MLDEIGQAVNLFIEGGVSTLRGNWVHKRVEDPVVRISVVLKRFFDFDGCNPLFLDQCAEDGKLEHVTHGELLVGPLEVELHLDLLPLVLLEEGAFSWFVDLLVEEVQKTDYHTFVRDCEVKSCSIGLDKRHTLPRIPDVLFFVDRLRRSGRLGVVWVVEVSQFLVLYDVVRELSVYDVDKFGNF